MKGIFHKRLPKFEPFDKITLEIVPRFKESELSGDEWRHSVRVSFWFKGGVVHTFTGSSMNDAILMLGHEWVNACSPISLKVISTEHIACDQPSCPELAQITMLIKRQFSEGGDLLDSDDNPLKKCRQFCSKHSTRGNASREDSDDNYEVITPERKDTP